MSNLLIFGRGYTGAAIAAAARHAGFAVTATTRNPANVAAGDPLDQTIPFDLAEPAIQSATHILVTAAPDANGDPVLARYAPIITAAITAAPPRLRWIGYLSSTVVYGNRDGGWVDEDTPPAPSQPRGQRRLDAENAWSGLATRCAVDIFRLGGIYGPGRSVFDDLRAGHARHLVKPGHQFGRIHRDDITRAVLTAMTQSRPPGCRILNLVDDEPAESAAVLREAAALLGISPPPPVSWEDARATLSPMALSFWSENRKVACARTRESLGLAWRYPTYREGLRAILAEELGNRRA